MPNYRRLRLDGGTYFFTVVLADRRQELLVAHVDLLRAAFARTKAQLPFTIDAIVVLPDHLHCLWTLPDGDSDFSKRWHRIKAIFSRGLRAGTRSPRPIWQPRFWEHAVRDDADYRAHFDYIHFNPVKHGHVSNVVDWPFSSFHRHVRHGVYPVDWATASQAGSQFGERARE